MVIIGVVNVLVKGVLSGFIDVFWGRVEILKVVRGFWFGIDGYLMFFVLNLEGFVEFVEFLEGLF